MSTDEDLDTSLWLARLHTRFFTSSTYDVSKLLHSEISVNLLSIDKLFSYVSWSTESTCTHGVVGSF
jgi:hypothetical protein